MPVKLIINSDDFGFSSSVNAAVAEARKFGILTSASLMVTGKAAREAVSIAKDDPGLAVGLHLTLSNGKSVLPKTMLPELVDENSNFSNNPVSASLKYYFNNEARRQLRCEIESQFLAFAETGLAMDHIDGHQHLHLHPAVLPIVIEYAHKYMSKGIRIPCDPFKLNLLTDCSRLLSKFIVASGHSYLARASIELIERSNLTSCNVCIGSLMSGNMNAEYVIKMLKKMNAQSIEVFFHPSQYLRIDAFGPNPGDLSALTSSKLKYFINSNGYQLTNYTELSETDNECC